MDFGSTPALLISGAILIGIGLMLQNYASRYDFLGMLLSSIWQIIRGKRSAERPTEIEGRLNEIASAGTVFGKARRVTGNVIGHFVGPIVGLVSLGFFLGGGALVLFAIFHR